MISPQEIYDQMLNPMLVTDTAGTIIFYNRMAKSFEKHLAEPIAHGISVYRLISGHLAEQVKTAIADTLRTRQPRLIEASLSDERNDIVYIDIVFNVIIGEDDRVKYISLIGRDVTDRKIYERKTSALSTEFLSLMENANAIIFSVDSSHYITSWNKECARATGLPRKDALARPLHELVEPEMQQGLQSTLGNLVAGNSMRNVEIELHKVNGERAVFLLNGTPNRNSLDQVVGVLFVGQDITELSEYRNNLEKKVKDKTLKLREVIDKEKKLIEIKNRFVSIASHEFKLPLGAIDTTLRAMDTSRRLSQQDRERVNDIRYQVNRMKSLLEDVLALEKNGAARLKANSRGLNLVTTLQALIAEVQVATNNSHEVDTSFFSDEIMIDSDEKFLRNIFLNLLSNAIKYSPHNKRIKVSVEKYGYDSVSVTVSDYGIGIPNDDLDRIFEPFNRGSNCGRITGTGLGLSIVKRAIDALGANIQVTSEPGTGSVFTVYFPQRTTQMNGGVKLKLAGPGNTGHNQNIK